MKNNEIPQRPKKLILFVFKNYYTFVRAKGIENCNNLYLM